MSDDSMFTPAPRLMTLAQIVNAAVVVGCTRNALTALVVETAGASIRNGEDVSRAELEAFANTLRQCEAGRTKRMRALRAEVERRAAEMD